MMRSPLLSLTLACVMACPTQAVAHAFLDHATPAVGSTIHASPPQVKVWFTQQIEPAFSSLQVLDAKGKRVDKGDARVESRDAMLLVVSLPPLTPGTYRVTWRVLSVDTHVTEGDYNFDVAP